MRWSTLIFKFVSEKAAEDFVRFIENEYELEVHINAYLHIEVPSEEFDDQEALLKLYHEAEDHGGEALL
jgi:hypothetical protein